MSVSAQALAADNKTVTQSLVQLKAQMQQQSEMRAAAERQLSDVHASVQSMKTQHLHMQSALTVSAVPGGLLLFHFIFLFSFYNLQSGVWSHL